MTLQEYLNSQPIGDRKTKNCVYCAFNLITGKGYVGYTQSQLNVRIKAHYSRAKWHNESQNYFHSSLVKYKKDDFAWYVLSIGETLEELKIKESHFIALFETNKRSNGYNLTSGGEQSYFTDEVKKKISQKAIERNLGGENNPFFGKHHSEETKARWSEIRKGKCWNEGYKHTEKTKTKLSEIRKELCKDPVVIRNMSLAQSKPVRCLNNETVYESLKLAATSLGIKRSGISAQLTNRLKTYKGYKFEYQ